MKTISGKVICDKYLQISSIKLFTTEKKVRMMNNKKDLKMNFAAGSKSRMRRHKQNREYGNTVKCDGLYVLRV